MTTAAAPAQIHPTGVAPRARRWPLLLLLVVGLAVVGMSVVRARQSKGEAVRIATVVQKTIVHRVLAQGKVRVRNQVEVGSEVAGRVATVDVEMGDLVKQGDLLFALDGEQLRSAVDQLQAAVSGAQALLTRAELGVTEANRALARDQGLLKKGVVAEDMIKLSESRAAMAEAERAQAQANVERSRVDFARAKDALRRARVLAPQAGTVVAVGIEPGQIVTAATGLSASPDAGMGLNMAGGSAPVILADLSELLVKLDVDELDVGDVKVGQKAIITAQGIRPFVFEGVVERVGLMGREAMGAVLFVVEVKIDRTAAAPGQAGPTPAIMPTPQSLLRPGMSASAEIEVERIDNANSIPLTAVLEGDAQEKDETRNDRVFVVEGEGQLRVKEVVVQLGPADGDDVAIVSGLQKDQRVVEGPYRVLRALTTDDAVTIDDKKKEGRAKDGKDGKDGKSKGGK
jgi:multidrug efflux pump subunit AcrA (membrane-fusion protein)